MSKSYRKAKVFHLLFVSREDFSTYPNQLVRLNMETSAVSLHELVSEVLRERGWSTASKAMQTAPLPHGHQLYCIMSLRVTFYNSPVLSVVTMLELVRYI